MAVLHRAGWPPTQNGGSMLQRRARRMEANLSHATGMLGASLTEAGSGKALSDRPALEPYRGKPAVRNLRGDDGNVGIIRSPIRAIVLPNPASGLSAGAGSVLTVAISIQRCNSRSNIRARS